MATTFLKNLFGTSSNKGGSLKSKENSSKPDVNEDFPPIPPARRLSLSKSGKMKRKQYGKQVSVKDDTLFAPPGATRPDDNRNRSSENSVTKSNEPVESIDEVIADMLNTVKNTKV